MTSPLSMSGLHGKMAIIALIAIAMWGGVMLVNSKRDDAEEITINIGVEHQEPATFVLSRSIEGKAHIAEIGNESEETLLVSVPSDWERDEVRNASLAEVTSEEPNFGFKRWHIPPHAIISFRVPYEWRHLVIHNPSTVLLKARVTTVDLARERTDTNVYLLTDTQLELHF